MSQTLTLELEVDAYEAIERQARARGISAARWLAEALQRPDGLLQRIRASQEIPDRAHRPTARERFESHFGEIDLGRPTGTDNEEIDADMAGGG